MVTINITQDRLNLLLLNGFRPTKCLDIGAYIGQWTAGFKKVFNECVVYAVEPNTDTHIQDELKKHTNNVYVELLSDKVKQVRYYKSPSSNQTGNSYNKEQTTYFIDCNVEQRTTNTLDNIFDDTFDFIKIDTQGAELDILNGGEQTIKRAEFVLIEVKILEYNEGAPTFLDVIKKMDEYGFVPYDIFELHYLNSRHCNELDILFAKKDSMYIPRGILE